MQTNSHCMIMWCEITRNSCETTESVGSSNKTRSHIKGVDALQAQIYWMLGILPEGFFGNISAFPEMPVTSEFKNVTSGYVSPSPLTLFTELSSKVWETDASLGVVIAARSPLFLSTSATVDLTPGLWDSWVSKQRNIQKPVVTFCCFRSSLFL